MEDTMEELLDGDYELSDIHFDKFECVTDTKMDLLAQLLKIWIGDIIF